MKATSSTFCFGIGLIRWHRPFNAVEAEVRALLVPEKKAQRRGQKAEKPKLPQLRAVAEHLAAVADVGEGAEADVEPIDDQTEATVFVVKD